MVTGTVISSTAFNALTQDLATGLSTCLLKDGTQTATAIVPFALGLSSAALIDISAAGAGQIKFPATQNASSNANTLDDYEEGTWTPVLTFGTPGDLAVVYSTQAGSYTKIGRMVFLDFAIATSSFTFTTASGTQQITGSPFTSAASSGFVGTLAWQGITKANYTNTVSAIASGSTAVFFEILGQGQALAIVVATDTPTTNTQIRIGTVSYRV